MLVSLLVVLPPYCNKTNRGISPVLDVSETLWRYSLDVGPLFPNNFEFLYVCQSVNWYILLLKLDKLVVLPALEEISV